MERISTFQASLSEKCLDGALILHNPNMFYYSGTVQNAFLWIPSQGKAALRVRKHLDKAIQDSPLDDIQPFKSLKQIPELMKTLISSSQSRIGMEFDVVPVTEWRMWQEMLPRSEFVDISSVISSQRSVKDCIEIESIRAAGNIVVSTFMEVADLY
ncbi:MAG: aminopeptidase P family N-terminal domain-containing protein, partial [Planctomycetota bacterium]